MSWYNIYFNIGDKSNDGHGRYEEFHIKCNYSVDVITDIYDEICMELNWKFCDECSDYENIQISDKGVNNLLKLKIITKNDLKNGNYYIYTPDDFIEIFFNIIKTKLPNLIWEDRDLNESILYCLDESGYGLFS